MNKLKVLNPPQHAVITMRLLPQEHWEWVGTFMHPAKVSKNLVEEGALESVPWRLRLVGQDKTGHYLFYLHCGDKSPLEKGLSWLKIKRRERAKKKTAPCKSR